MKEYFNTLLQNINKNLIRYTSLDPDSLGYEALYNNDKFLSANFNEELKLTKYLKEELFSYPTLVFFGSGHVAAALYKIFENQNFKIIIVDERSELNNNVNFPQANCITTSYDKLEKMELVNPYFCIFTHGHMFDATCLKYALQYDTPYIGMIGSKTKIRQVFTALIKDGYTQEALDKIYTPIGLEINSQTPFEIGIAIAGQIIQTYRTVANSIIDLDVYNKIEKGDVLCRIISKRGSGPREVGTTMLVKKDKVYGTIGGGAVEAEAIKLSQTLSENTIRHFHLDIKDDLKMACGGDYKVLFTLIK